MNCKGAQVVIGTLGRVADMIKKKMAISVHKLKMLILDEGDDLIYHSKDLLYEVFTSLPVTQSILSCTTIGTKELQIVERFMQNARWMLPCLTSPINHFGYLLPKNVQFLSKFVASEDKKADALVSILDGIEISYLKFTNYIDVMLESQTIVYCNTKRLVDWIVEILESKKMHPRSLHADLAQQSRDMILKEYRANTCRLLVATDSASRGLDFPQTGVIINYSVCTPTQFVHRVGRTGRADRAGKCFTLVTPADSKLVKDIESYLLYCYIHNLLTTCSYIGESISKK
jgi:superfamily II DNA/RNA helicase